MRDASGALTDGEQYFPLGRIAFASGAGTNFFYTKDHLGSIRESVKTVSGISTIDASYLYSPYGSYSQISGSDAPLFGFAGMYRHDRSNLYLTMFRPYSPSMSRWLSRDPLGESAGLNLYGYAGNNPISFVDPLGLRTYLIADRWHIWGVIPANHSVMVITDPNGVISAAFGWGTPVDNRGGKSKLIPDPDLKYLIGQNIWDVAKNPSLAGDRYHPIRISRVQVPGLSEEESDIQIRRSAWGLEQERKQNNYQWVLLDPGKAPSGQPREGMNCSGSTSTVRERAGATVGQPLFESHPLWNFGFPDQGLR